MNRFNLSPKTTTGAVALNITNLARSLDFYQDVLGFKIHFLEKHRASLGVGAPDLLYLQETTGARRVLKTTGLYHFAILVPTRFDLAQVLQQIIETQTAVTGFSDHLVSEAIYLPDPDGNGIEIYRDRPRHTWHNPDGSLRMGTDSLDVQGLLQELPAESKPWDGLPLGTRIGHIHLHVADLEPALHFYQSILGFDLTMRYGPSAAFLSAGGYHHHIGINTWNGIGVSQPPSESPGLRHFTLQIPDQGTLNELLLHLSRESIDFENGRNGLWLRDPSGNLIQLIVTSPTAST